MVKENTIMTPSSLFIIALAAFYCVTALLHPQEIGLVFYGLLYIICIPSAFLLLSIYSMVNMNNVSWGTREVTTTQEQAMIKDKVRAHARIFARKDIHRHT